MTLLALLLFTPWFAILGWAYWAFPRGRGDTRVFDVAALLLALAASSGAMHWGWHYSTSDFGGMWKQVLATLLGYKAFLLVLGVAWYWRRKKGSEVINSN